ncbi:glycyl radical protein [Lacticaseibacillus sp. GG6-2]
MTKPYDVKPGFSQPTQRIKALKAAILDATPRIEVERARLITESYKETEALTNVLRHAKGFAHILAGLPIVIRDNELIVGTATVESRSCQMFPEYGPQGLDEEFDTVATRSADPFAISDSVKTELKEIFKYWQGKTTSEYATALMTPDTLKAYHAGVFTVGNYHQGGVGHLAVDYGKVLTKGIRGVMDEIVTVIQNADHNAPDWIEKEQFYQAALIGLKAVVDFANRYAAKAKEMAAATSDAKRKAELLKIAENCARVPEYPASNFYEALQSFWFIQLTIQIESSGHSISPGRFDQYMDPFFEADTTISQDEAQELLDCLFVKFNDLNKLRDIGTATAFAGYQLWQNTNCGGQTRDGRDATNTMSYMEIESMAHVMMAMPSLSIRVWNETPDELVQKACELSRLGGGQPAFYNDEEIITSKVNRGETLEDARNYAVIGCVEPASQGKENSWCDAALFNLPKVLEIAMNNGRLDGEAFGPQTGEFEDFKTFEAFEAAYVEQMKFCVNLLVRADNAVDLAHEKLGQLAFVSTLIEDCIGRGETIQSGGAHYNFTGPQGIGVANIGNALMVVKKLVFDEKRLTMAQLKDAMAHNWGKDDQATASSATATDDYDQIAAAVRKVLQESGNFDLSNLDLSATKPVASNNSYQQIHEQVMAVPKFGNDIDEVDLLARSGSRVYCEELEKYSTPRGGIYNAGLYPVSGNVLFGSYIEATPDGRYAHETIADGVSPTRGTDTLGPTAAANSVAKLDHFIASNGTLYNMKFSPSAVAGDDGLRRFGALIRGFFDKKGAHVQFNVIDRQTLLDAQANPQAHKDLIVRVAGYSAQFIALDKTVQDDIIERTEFETV